MNITKNMNENHEWPRPFKAQSIDSCDNRELQRQRGARQEQIQRMRNIPWPRMQQIVQAQESQNVSPPIPMQCAQDESEVSPQLTDVLSVLWMRNTPNNQACVQQNLTNPIATVLSFL